jgi:hypothetical protein
LSTDPAKRERQLANLRRGGKPPAPDQENRRAATHGGYARIALDRLEDRRLEIFEALASDAPVREGDGGLPAADGVIVGLLAECLCRLEDVSGHIRDRGLFDRKGRLRPAVELEARLRREAADHAASLGMTPSSRARLGVDLARMQQVDLAQRWAAEHDGREHAVKGSAEDA